MIGLLHMLRRRWWLVLIGLVLATGGAIWVARVVPLDYSASGSQLLLPPKSQTTVAPGEQQDPNKTTNPYLLLGNLDQALGVLTERLNSETMSTSLRAGYPKDATYLVGTSSTAGAPIAVVTVQSTDPAVTLRLLHAVDAQLPIELLAMQNEVAVAAPDLITLSEVATDETPKADSTNRVRLALLTGIGGLVVVLILVAVLDWALRRRRVAAADSATARVLAEQS